MTHQLKRFLGRTLLLVSAFLLMKGNILLAEDWKTFDKLIEEDKLSAAENAVEKILIGARNTSDADWARALVKLTAIRMETGEYETAVKKLKAEAWPKAPAEHAMVELYYAQSLFTYLDEYSWEIREREKTVTEGPVDLKKWTADQIYEEALQAYNNVWQMRAKLGDRKISDFKHFVRENSYPSGLRPTLRDLISYKIAEALQNTSYWRPAENNDLYRQNLPDLLTGKPGIKGDFQVQDPRWHPVARLTYVLADLEEWNDSKDNKAGELEARIFLHRALHMVFTGEDDRKAITSSLASYLKKNDDNTWAATGFGTLAEFYRDTNQLVTAHKVASACIKEYKGQTTEHCQHILKAIEQPSYDVTSMAVDGLKERSIQIRYKNLRKLYFRAYKIDLESVTKKSSDYNLLPGYREFTDLVKKKADLSWSEELPATTDFAMHSAYATPPFKEKGFYTVITSAREDFGTKDNELSGFTIDISSLIIRTEATSNGVTVTVLDGEKGSPQAQVTVSLYAYNYRTGHKKIKDAATDNKGQVSFAGLETRSSYFLIAKKGKNAGLQTSPDIGGRYREAKSERQALIYTDRGVYRPNQSIKWKVIAYTRTGNESDLKIAPKTKFDVVLYDTNYQVVKKTNVFTNEFGSAAGEFTVPEGRLLGEWHVSTTHGGNSHWISVEEYKRPTFEISFKEIESEIRLNSKATVSGEAKYYFGAPVADGKVSYRIERTPVFPEWMYFYFWGSRPDASTQMIDAGSTRMQEDGSFNIPFTPEAKAPSNEIELTTTYRYKVSVDITDAGGETRSQTTYLTAGHVTVQADLAGIDTICFDRDKCDLVVARQTLNGTAAPGKGRYELIALQMPEKTVPPSELPVPELSLQSGKDEGRITTPGDKLRPRWEERYSIEEYLSQWPAGKTVDIGEITHGKDGRGNITSKALAPGPYKILYTTKDSNGKEYKAWKFFIVAGSGSALKIPAVLTADASSKEVGKSVRIFAHNGFSQQAVVRLYHKSKLVREIALKPGSQILTVPVEQGMRGGFTAVMDLLHDYQAFRLSDSVYVPWDNKQLEVSFERLREVMRPGTKESITMKIKGANATDRAAEVLALMYDKSLDLIRPLSLQNPLGLFPTTSSAPSSSYNLGANSGSNFLADGFKYPPSFTNYITDFLLDADEDQSLHRENFGYGGGGGKAYSKRRKMAPGEMAMESAAMEEDAEGFADEAPAQPVMAAPAAAKPKPGAEPAPPPEPAEKGQAPREIFAETAFFLPHLVTDKKGEVTATFTLPDSLTAWNVYAVGMMKDFSSGLAYKETKTAKDLMVRLYSPRFFREGDEVALGIVINSASKEKLSGSVQVVITDDENGEDLSKTWKLDLDRDSFSLQPDGSISTKAVVKVPPGVRTVKVKASAKAGNVTDSEVRGIPVLPGRMHLVQSRFAALTGTEKEVVRFDDLKKSDDATRINEKMVVTIDGQLFFSTLKALPYLIEYPYECTEQTLNRFLSAGIMSSLFTQSPDLVKAAAKFSARKTQYEPWKENDPNSRMLLEESPWLNEGRGGKSPDDAALINILKKETADSVRASALKKLEKSQTSSGGFPWFAGGPPSPYMTLYLVYGFAKAQEFGIEIPKPMAANAWKYLAAHYKELWAETTKKKAVDHHEFLTFLNFTASSFKDKSVYEKHLTDADRKRILEYSFKHWKKHSPYLKLMLSLTLHRMDRSSDANLVLDSVLDRARTSKDTGTSWAAEDRSWLWYNDSVEMHAFALRTLTEMNIKSPLNAGIVQWIFMNKKLNQWKSTKATAEVIYSVATWLKKTGSLNAQDQVQVSLGKIDQTFTFKKDEYVGRQYLEVKGPEVAPAMADVSFQKKAGGMVFASAAWHYSTEKLPEEARGDFFVIDRKFFLRKASSGEMTLKPLGNKDKVEIGDEVEVHISIRNKHQAEYVHLRDPRPAGFEPVSLTSGYKWDLGISWYEEIRDNGTNFFFEWLPTGEYTLKYGLRAANAGTFKTMPAEIQSMYAPEFNAFSSGRLIEVGK